MEKPVVVALFLAVGLVGGAAAQVPRPTPHEVRPLEPPPSHDGGYSPFREKAFAGVSFNAAALEQPSCPMSASIVGLARLDRGVSVSLRLANVGGAALSRHVVGAWVIVPDGTVRGYQRYESARHVEAGTVRSVDLVIRSSLVQPGDIIVVAVEEALGGRSPWRRDRKDLEREARTAVAP